MIGLPQLPTIAFIKDSLTITIVPYVSIKIHLSQSSNFFLVISVTKTILTFFTWSQKFWKKALPSIYQQFNSMQFKCTPKRWSKTTKEEAVLSMLARVSWHQKQKILGARSKGTAKKKGKGRFFMCKRGLGMGKWSRRFRKKQHIPSSFNPAGSRLSIQRHCNSMLPK